MSPVRNKITNLFSDEYNGNNKPKVLMALQLQHSPLGVEEKLSRI